MKTKKKKVATYNMTYKQIEDIKQTATKEALDEAFNLMILLPMMVKRKISF